MFRRKKVVLDHNIIITGACGGLGSEFARRMYQRDAHVYLLGYDEEKLSELSRELGGAFYAVLDVTDEGAVGRVIHFLGDSVCGGEIDMLACFAGIAGQSVAGGRGDLYHSIMHVNYDGTVSCVNAALPYIKNAGGQIVLTSSMAQFFDLPFMGAYGASKAAVGKFGRTLRLELRRTRMKVTVLYPNVVDTNMTTEGYTTRVGKLVQKFVPVISLESAMSMIENGVLKGRNSVFVPGWMRPVPLVAPIINSVISLAMRPFMPRLREQALEDDGAVKLTTVQRAA